MLHRPVQRLAGAAALLLALPFLQSCVSSQAHQRALDEKDSTIRALRDERAQLKSEILALRASHEDTLSQIADASAAPAAPAPAPAPAAKSFPELDQVGVGYAERDGNMVLTIPSSITFASGQAKLSDAGKRALQKVAATLKREYASARYAIEGHTDADPIQKSSFGSNRELSVARAMAVLSYLVEECGVPDERCVVAGHGQYDPVAPNAKEADKARNRRVEIVVLR